MKYVVTRYYFDSLFKAEAERNFVADIQNDPVLKQGNYSYAIGHVSAEDMDGEEVVRGLIGRIPSAEARFVYDTKEKDFVPTQREDFADVIIEFCAIPSQKLLLFQLSSKFDHETAISKFKQIYLQSNQSYVAGFEIDYILNTTDVYNELNKLSGFIKVSFKDLRPSNPDAKDDYAEIEALIKETGGDRTDLNIKMDSNSRVSEANMINIDSKLVRQALALSNHGYGRGEITGSDAEGEERTIRTYQYKRIVEIDFQDDGSIAKIKEIVEEGMGNNGKE